MIVFPAIDLKAGQVVRLAEGDMARATVYGDDPAAQALLFAEAGAQHLHVVDLDGAFAGASREPRGGRGDRRGVPRPRPARRRHPHARGGRGLVRPRRRAHRDRHRRAQGPAVRARTWRATCPAASSSRSTRATAWSRPRAGPRSPTCPSPTWPAASRTPASPPAVHRHRPRRAAQGLQHRRDGRSRPPHRPAGDRQRRGQGPRRHPHAGAARRRRDRGRDHRPRAVRRAARPGRGDRDGGDAHDRPHPRHPLPRRADGRVVKGVNFVDLKRRRRSGRAGAGPTTRPGADELCFLDISASHEGRGTLLDVVRRTAEVCFMPLTVGGGVRSRRGCARAAAGGRGQGRGQLRRGRAARAGRRDRRASSAASASSPRSMRGKPGERLGDLHPRRPPRDRHRRGRARGPAGRARRGRAAGHLDGRRRHPGRLRPRADPRDRRRGARCRWSPAAGSARSSTSSRA